MQQNNSLNESPLARLHVGGGMHQLLDTLALNSNTVSYIGLKKKKKKVCLGLPQLRNLL